MVFFVVFKGQTSGVYEAKGACWEVLQGCNETDYQGFSSYDEAVGAWEKICNTNGLSEVDFQDGLYEPGRVTKKAYSYVNKGLTPANLEEGSSSSSTAMMMNSEMFAWEQIRFAERSNAYKFIKEHSMQKELEEICRKLRIKPPVYTNEEVCVRNGIAHVRYKVALEGLSTTENPVFCYGRFARNGLDGKEDAAVVAIRRIISITCPKIRDFNYYNVKILEQRIQVLEAEKITMGNVIRTMNEEIEILLPETK